MYTIGQLVKEFGLSRSSLLYYDRIGLLQASGRSAGNYRLYSQGDFERLQQIELYKQAGLSLQAVARVLEQGGNASAEVLEKRLLHLNDEIAALRSQQQLIISLLGQKAMQQVTKTMTKEQWVSILAESGMDDEAMRQWHIQFELQLPQMHTDFLQSLGIDAAEIAAIKSWR